MNVLYLYMQCDMAFVLSLMNMNMCAADCGMCERQISIILCLIIAVTHILVCLWFDCDGWVRVCNFICMQPSCHWGVHECLALRNMYVKVETSAIQIPTCVNVLMTSINYHSIDNNLLSSAV